MRCDELLEARYEIRFCDAKPPYEIQFYLEKTVRTLLRPSYQGQLLVLRGVTNAQGPPYSLELAFDAALPGVNCYTFRVHASWAKMAPANHDYFRRTSKSWFEYWSRPFQATPPAEPSPGSTELYRNLAGQTLAMESQFPDPASLQVEILRLMRAGARFSSAHKEGGTIISWQEGAPPPFGPRFVRQDYGESNETETFPDAAAFLAFLRQYFDWETSRYIYPEKAPELDVWKLILRLLEPPRPGKIS